MAASYSTGYSWLLLCVSSPAWIRVEAVQLHGHEASTDLAGDNGPRIIPALTRESGSVLASKTVHHARHGSASHTLPPMLCEP